MKKLIIFVGLMGAQIAQAGAITRMPVLDYLSTENYAMFEIKSNTPTYQKIILDCQGFNMGVYFYKNRKVETQVHLDEADCEDFHQFLSESNNQHRPVCLELDADARYIEVSDKKVEECK